MPILTPRKLKQLRAAVVAVVSLTLLTGVVFPLVLLALGRLVAPARANGSLIERDGMVIGSELIGQKFNGDAYFESRPSAAGAGYDGTASGGTNLGPLNTKLAEQVEQLAKQYRKRNGLAADAVVPMDAVTASGSGLDPDITPENAALQIARVARARGLSDDTVRRVVQEHTIGRQWGFLGSPRVPVLEVNIALDRMSRVGRTGIDRPRPHGGVETFTADDSGGAAGDGSSLSHLAPAPSRAPVKGH
jgi:potassium-transporting ATPase KdpC subunit